MLRILTLNIQQYSTRHGPWNVRRELIAAAIQRVGPDLVALQAVRRDPDFENGVDQAAQLARMLDGYDSLFVPATEVTGGVVEGSAFLSRVPLTETEARLLEPCPHPAEDPNRRLVLRARVGTDGAALDVFNCHLSWVEPTDERNLAEALPFIRCSRGPRLVVGDMNAEPGNVANVAAEGFVDVWPPRQPCEQGRLFTRIDHAWASADLVTRVRNISLVGNLSVPGADGTDWWRPSDPLGLVVELS